MGFHSLCQFCSCVYCLLNQTVFADIYTMQKKESGHTSHQLRKATNRPKARPLRKSFWFSTKFANKLMHHAFAHMKPTQAEDICSVSRVTFQARPYDTMKGLSWHYILWIRYIVI